MAKKKSKTKAPQVLDLEAAHLPKPADSPKSQPEKSMVSHILAPIALEGKMIGLEATAVRNRYVLQHARFYMPSERPKKYRKGRRKSCWGNSQLLAMDHPELTYVEGYAFSETNHLAYEHAWCAMEDGTVVDTTWPEPGIVYYGVPFGRDALMKHIFRTIGERGETRPIMEPDFFDSGIEWLGGRMFGSRREGE